MSADAVEWSIAVHVSMALVLLGAGLSKLRSADRFEGVLANYRLLPRTWVSGVAHLLPVLEVIVGGSLLVPSWSARACLAAAGLVLVFTAAVSINLLRGRRHIDCGCFDRGSAHSLSGWLVVRNVIMAAALIFSAIGTAATANDAGGASLYTLGQGGLAGVSLFIIVQGQAMLGSPRSIMPRETRP